VFGSYAGTLRGSYPIGDALGLTFDHLALIALSTGIVPLAALVLLLVDSFRVRDPNSDVRALLAVTTCAVVLVSVQVGFFSARYAQHLLGRDLAALPPLLALVFALWLASDSRRHIVAATASAFLVLAVLLLTPWNHLVGANAFPDTFAIALLDDLHGRNPADVVTVVSVLVLAAFVLLPRRARLLLAVFVVAGLVVNSVLASNKIRTLANADQTGLVGSPPDWIDRAAKGPVTYLYDGEAYWNGVWQERVWNRRLTSVLSIQPYRVPGPVGQTIFAIPTSGVLPMKNRYVVASDIHTFVGEPVAHLTQTGLDVTGLTLWHLDMPPRLAVVKRGFQPNGDMTAPATVDVYGCTRGQLELTLLPKATSVLRITLNGRQVVEQHVAGQPVWHGSVPVPSTSKPRLCEFTIYGQSLLGSTRIDWVPG
jgi:hypothetical protein